MAVRDSLLQPGKKRLHFVQVTGLSPVPYPAADEPGVSEAVNKRRPPEGETQLGCPELWPAEHFDADHPLGLQYASVFFHAGTLVDGEFGVQSIAGFLRDRAALEHQVCQVDGVVPQRDRY